MKDIGLMWVDRTDSSMIFPLAALSRAKSHSNKIKDKHFRTEIRKFFAQMIENLM